MLSRFTRTKNAVSAYVHSALPMSAVCVETEDRFRKVLVELTTNVAAEVGSS